MDRFAYIYQNIVTEPLINGTYFGNINAQKQRICEGNSLVANGKFIAVSLNLYDNHIFVL
jgi:hypothetical protein